MVVVVSTGLASSVTVYFSRCVTCLVRDKAHAWMLKSVIAHLDMS